MLKRLRKRIKYVILMVVISFTVTGMQAQWQPGQKYDLNKESYTTRVLWETDNANYAQRINEYRGYHHIVASYNNNSYIVYIDNDWRPRIVKVTSEGTSQEAFVEADDYQILANDSHQFFALGIDKQGYIHVFGDMHNFPRYNSDHLPARFQDAKCMYWRSDNPEDISSFTFHGNRFGDCPLGTSFTYPQIFYDQNGGLYFSTRVRSETARQYAAVNYNRYNEDTKQWELIGGTNEYNNQCLFYEDNGENGGTYSKPCRSLHFDLDNRAHFVSSLYNHDEPKPLPETNGKYNSDLVYAASDDLGNTFKRADGTAIVEIPMRIDAETQRPDVLMQGAIINATVSQAITDYSGKVYATGVHYSENGDEKYFCHSFDNTTKNWKDVSSIRPQANGYFVTDKTGVITFIEKGTSRVHRFLDFEEPRVLEFPFFDIGIDRLHMLKTGNIRGIPKRKNASQPFQLIEIEIDRPVSYPGLNEGLSDDASLLSLSADIGFLKPAFSSDTYQYTLYVSTATESVNISSTSKHAGATVIGNGAYSNISGKAIITVTAEDGVTKLDYVVNIVETEIKPFSPAGDTYVRGGDYTATNYNEEEIRVKTPASNPNFLREGLMKFSLSGIEASKIAAAFLKLSIHTVKGDTQVEFHDCETNWDESTVTWNDAASLPIAGTPFLSHNISASDDGAFVQLDITDYVKNKLSSGSDFGFRMLSTVDENNFKIWSKEYQEENLRPELSIIEEVHVGIDDLNLNGECSLYPNPASDYVIVELKQYIEGSISVCDLFGKEVLAQRFDGDKVSLDLKGINPGIYLLSIEANSTIFKPKKIIVE